MKDQTMAIVLNHNGVRSTASRMWHFLRALKSNTSGLALIEFSMILPILLVMATSGLELVNYVVTIKRIGEISGTLADNASRMGDQNAIANKPISESEINDLFVGADLQGNGLEIATRGRIIISSLQRNDDGGQTIAWQRCFGALDVDSAYGEEGEGAEGTSFAGMGPTGNEITAAEGTAVMVVEFQYQYEQVIPIIDLDYNPIVDVTAFNVRDDRDLGMPQNAGNVTVSTC
ncbi:MAG: TadE/TadG family type IV pilus assembly protein [Pseudomonadota bacterium]|jgi:hypothetical protein